MIENNNLVQHKKSFYIAIKRWQINKIMDKKANMGFIGFWIVQSNIIFTRNAWLVNELRQLVPLLLNCRLPIITLIRKGTLYYCLYELLVFKMKVLLFLITLTLFFFTKFAESSYPADTQTTRHNSLSHPLKSAANNVGSTMQLWLFLQIKKTV